MSNINHIILIGSVTEAPKTKFGMENSTSMSTFTLAVDRPARQDGTTETDFMPIVAWGKAADYAAENLKSSTVVIVEGRIQTRPVENNGQRTWITEIVASSVKNVKIAAQSPTADVSAPASQTVAATVGQNPFTEDDVPF
jgi:single-strand DNA-binding protein